MWDSGISNPSAEHLQKEDYSNTQAHYRQQNVLERQQTLPVTALPGPGSRATSGAGGGTCL